MFHDLPCCFGVSLHAPGFTCGVENPKQLKQVSVLAQAKLLRPNLSAEVIP